MPSGVRTITSIICITLLEWQAMEHGINGELFVVIIAALSGLGGYSIAKEILKR